MQNARRMRRQKKGRVLVRTVALMNLLVIGLATGCGGGDQRESVPSARNSGKEQKAQRLSPTAEFRKAVLDLQPGEKVRDVEIDEQPGGGYAISASFESGQSLALGAGLGRSLIESDMKGRPGSRRTKRIARRHSLLPCARIGHVAVPRERTVTRLKKGG